MKSDTTFVRKDNQIARLAKGTHTHTHIRADKKLFQQQKKTEVK